MAVSTTRVQLSSPSTSDGKPIFTPAVIPGNHNLYFCGRGDDLTTKGRGKGQPFRVKQTGPTSPPHTQVSWQFVDSIYIAGGKFWSNNGAEGDEVHLDLLAPATPVTPNGTNTGNCNLSDAGGQLPAPILIVPAAGDGAYDVDVDAALYPALANKADGSAPNKVTQAVPVPAFQDADAQDAPAGFWDWDSDTGVITPAVGGGGETLGFWNLYAAELSLTRWVAGIQLWDLEDDGSGQAIGFEFNMPTKAKKLLPHWVSRATFELVGTQSVRGSWMLNMGREVTT